MIDDAYGKEEICKAAQILCQTPEIQSSYFVNTALFTVLDTELYPLNRELTDNDSLNQLLMRNGYKGFISGITSVMIPKGSIWISVILKALLYLALIGITVVSFILKGYWVSFLSGSLYAYLEYRGCPFELLKYEATPD